MKKKNILLIITILCISLVLIGTSYAYWRFTYISDKTNVGQSKCLSIELTNKKNEISLTNTYPITGEEAKKLTPYSFTITNTCDTFISYDVNLEMLEGTTMNSKYMAVMINNEKKELLSDLDSTSTVMNGSVESRKLVSGSLGSADSVDYTLRLWMDESVTMSDDAMNKNFTSKIVVTAQPSNYSPKEAGYDTLHDAILANEYQTTPAEAIEKIEAKGEPDLSQTAPMITWKVKEENEEATISANIPHPDIIGKEELGTKDFTSDNILLTFGKSYIFNNMTGKYSLSDLISANPMTLDFTQNDYYFCAAGTNYNQSTNEVTVWQTLSDCSNIYKIKAVISKSSGTPNTSLYRLFYYFTATKLSQQEVENDKSDKGIYLSEDDIGKTYYYRGNVQNNNVYFAEFYWQIVRINGDNSIRLMYNGVEKNATGVSQSINNKTYQFNNLYNNPAYVGYMYGNTDGTTFNEIHSDTNSSPIKKVIDDWYESNIVKKGYDNYISSETGFCGDRSLYENSDGDGVTTNVTTRFGAYGRNVTNTAQFKCPNVERDLYTTSDNSIGNKALIYPVGLITYDELVFAGMNSKYTNKLSWAYSTSDYWTMSPSLFYATWTFAEEWLLNAEGYLTSGWYVVNSLGTRPVINLKADVKITGGIGTYNDPFVIDTNN